MATHNHKIYNPYSDISVSSIVSNTLKEVMRGKGLSEIPLPAEILEHRSSLERYLDLFGFVDFLVDYKIKTQNKDNDSQYEKFLEAVVSSYLAGWSVRLNMKRKPINSLKHEVLFAKRTHSVPVSLLCKIKENFTPNKPGESSFQDQRMEASIEVSENQEKENILIPVCSEVVFEQVSHHPPIVAFYWELPALGLIVQGFFQMNPVSSGQSFNIRLPGIIEYYDIDRSFHYEMNIPDLSLRNLIIGKKFLELKGQIEISGSAKAQISFREKPSWGGEKNFLLAKLYKKNNNLHKVLVGNYTKKVFCFSEEEVYPNGPSERVKTINGIELPEDFFKKYGSYTKLTKDNKLSKNQVYFDISWLKKYLKDKDMKKIRKIVEKENDPPSEKEGEETTSQFRPTDAVEQMDTSVFREMVIDTDKESPWESRNIWENLSMMIIKRVEKEANIEKRRIELLQRNRETTKKENAVQVDSLFNLQENGKFVFKKQLTQQDWGRIAKGEKRDSIIEWSRKEIKKRRINPSDSSAEN